MRALLIAAVMASAPARAEDDACRKWIDPGLPEGPVALGFAEADVATGRRACPRSEAGIGTRAGAVIDTPNFYGAISVDALVFGSHALSESLELFGTVEVVRYQFVQNATLKGQSLTLGQLTAGAALSTFARGNLHTATVGRVMFPTAFYMPHVRLIGAEIGEAVTYRPGERLEIHGYLGGDFSAGLSSAQALPRPGLLATAGAQYSPWSRFGVALDLTARMGATSYVGPALALRFRPFGPVHAELQATLPLAGTDRHDGAFGLRIGARL